MTSYTSGLTPAPAKNQKAQHHESGQRTCHDQQVSWCNRQVSEHLEPPTKPDSYIALNRGGSAAAPRRSKPPAHTNRYAPTVFLAFI
jgi:hypothetical protein